MRDREDPGSLGRNSKADRPRENINSEARLQSPNPSVEAGPDIRRQAEEDQTEVLRRDQADTREVQLLSGEEQGDP